MTNRRRSVRRHRAAAFLLAFGCLGCVSSDRPRKGAEIPSGWPVPPDGAVITSTFGAPRRAGRHQGLDLSCPRGTPVRATADGIVEFAGRSGDYGRMVILDHGNGWKTVFAHLKSIKVKKGRAVERGKTIGSVGKSGNASGYHLHYEVRFRDRPVDPRRTLDR